MEVCRKTLALPTLLCAEFQFDSSKLPTQQGSFTHSSSDFPLSRKDLMNWPFPCHEQSDDKQDSSAVRTPISSLTIATTSCQPKASPLALLAQCSWRCWASQPLAAEGNSIQPFPAAFHFQEISSTTLKHFSRATYEQKLWNSATENTSWLVLTCCRNRVYIWGCRKSRHNQTYECRRLHFLSKASSPFYTPVILAASAAQLTKMPSAVQSRNRQSGFD